MQPTKKSAPKPQSPVGEKRRRDTTSEKDGAEHKRRKSSVHQHDKAADETVLGPDIAALPEKQRASVESLVKILQLMVKQASDTRNYRIPDGETPSSIANKLALQIDHAAVQRFGAPTSNDSPYIVQFRSIIFNTKKNPVLMDRLLSGSLTAEGIAAMSTEEMASEDKQREYAALREAAEKQVVLTDDQGPRIRKTHKGEELVDDDDQSRTVEDSVFSAPARRHRDSVQEDGPVQDEGPTDGGSPMRVELPEDVEKGPLAIDTSTAQSSALPGHPSAKAFDVKKVWEHVRSPDQDHQTVHRRQSSIAMQLRHPQGPGEDADIDRLLKDEDNDTAMEDRSSDPSICWSGEIDMQGVGLFTAAARFVAGGDIGQAIPWNQLLASGLPISGRIDKERGNEYISSLRQSATMDVAVLAISPFNEEGRLRMDELFEYFYSRNRWGVINVEKMPNEHVRDLYLIPLEAGGSNLPGFLDMLEYCTIETPRKHSMMLLAMVARTDDLTAKHQPTPSYDHYPLEELAKQTPMQPRQEAPTPTQGPQFSPMTSMPPGPNYGSPYPPPLHGQAAQPPQYGGVAPTFPPKAVEILGHFITAPTAIHLLTSYPEISEVQMSNLRVILDSVPAASTDLQVLQEHLSQSINQRAR